MIVLTRAIRGHTRLNLWRHVTHARQDHVCNRLQRKLFGPLVRRLPDEDRLQIGIER
jgi:hypothetical protein